MKKTIYSKFNKDAIGELPLASFDGRVIVILTEQEAEKAVDFLLTADILGLDTETRPAFKRGQNFKVALLQVSNRDTCFLFRLNLIGLCPAVVRLLEDTTVTKVGLSWHDDLRMLHRRGDFTPGTFAELQQMAADFGIKDMSLQKLYANLFNEKISKRQRLTNWEAPVLSDLQKQYAALDAWACVRLYEALKRLQATGDYDLVVVPEEDPNAKQTATTAEETAEQPTDTANVSADAGKTAKKKKPKAKKKPLDKKPAAERKNNTVKKPRAPRKTRKPTAEPQPAE